MELLISEIVARVLCKCANLYRDVNDAVQKAFTVLRGNIWQKTEYTINPQMTKTKLVPRNKVSRLPMTCTVLKEKRFLKVVTSKTIFARPLAQITF